jgi:hypothetical protein
MAAEPFAGRSLMRQRAPLIEAGSKPPDPENYRFGKRLEDEIYVASKASATAVASYAPLSNFSGPSDVSLPWTPGTEMLSSP